MISVIIPVYKAESYLAECLDSILAQSYAGLEVICVNDGSPDSSLSILRDYEVKDSRVHVIDQENAGVTMARRNGVMQARGEWVTFVDADDSLPADALQILASRASSDTNLIVGFADVPSTKFAETISADTFRRWSLSGWFLPPMPWGKLYRRELLIGDTMTLSRDIVFGEDLLMIIRASFINELPVQIISEKVYNYRETDQSVSHQFKMTLNYEQKYYKLMIVSIPSKLIGQYLIETVRYRLYAINQIIPALVAEKDYSWRGHAFIMQFMEDARISKYKMGKRLYALLHWPCVSRIIFSILHVKLTNLH